MPHTPKYIIHADIRANGVVERSDVVGAIFGQTEGLLGEDMDLRDLQDASKVGRIDVDIESEGGRSFGTVQMATGMDRAETAVLAAALETISRVGPCRAQCEVVRIEDARAAKRRQVVDRATELLAEFESETLTSQRLVDEVRERVKESEITEYHGLPAGPRVADSDAVLIVEGRADVRKLLAAGIKNAIAVEGTDIPEAVAKLTAERTTTAFLDGDRGGDLILRELAQVGDIDYVAFAPAGQSVEDLDRPTIMTALRKKIPYEQVGETSTPREAFAPTDGGTVDVTTDSARDNSSPTAETSSESAAVPNSPEDVDSPEITDPSSSSAVSEAAEGVDTVETALSDPVDGPDVSPEQQARPDIPSTETTPATTPEEGDEGEITMSDAEVGDAAADGAEARDAPVESAKVGDATAETAERRENVGETVTEREAEQRDGESQADQPASDPSPSAEPQTLGDHIAAVIEAGTGTARLLDAEFDSLAEIPVEESFEAIAAADTVPHSVVIDGTVSQRLLDIAAQRGVGQLIGAELGEFVKQPAHVRVHEASAIDVN